MKMKTDIAELHNARKPEEIFGAVDDAAPRMLSVPGERGKKAKPPPIEEPTPAQTVTWRSPADRARSLGGLGERLGFSIATLTKATRGGVPAGKTIVIAGAPGAGKTTFVVQEGLRLARQGVWVAILAADEDADALLVRIGQTLGYDRDKLEAGDTETRVALALELEAIPTLMLVDMDESQTTIEEVAAELNRRADDKAAVLIVDSIQTTRVLDMEKAEGPRARVDMVMTAIKTVTKRYGLRTFCTCEMPRGGYRSQNAADRIDDLAVFKESGSIEYAATLAMVMRSVAGVDGLVDITIPKNRLGQKLACRMELNFARATFREVDMPAEGADSPLQKTKAKVLEVISKSIYPITSKGELQRRTKCNRTAVWKAIDELMEEGDLEVVNRAFKVTVPDRTGNVPGTARPEEPYHRTRPIGTVRVTGTGQDDGDADA